MSTLPRMTTASATVEPMVIFGQGGKVDQGGGAHMKAVGGGAAVADDVEAKLPPWPFDGAVRLPHGGA